MIDRAETEPTGHERTPLTGRLVALNGNTCHVLDRGKGRPVILLHGNGSLGEEILSAFPKVKGTRFIAPDRPGFGQSEPLQENRQEIAAQAVWLENLFAALGVTRAILVAHSISAGTALAFAAAHPQRVERLVLLAPFCRPTPERPMPGLRLTALPGIGRILRRVILPPLIRFFRKRIIRGFMAPNDPPPWLQGFPVTHAANPRAIKTTVDELDSFNAGMEKVESDLRVTVPVIAVHGLSDQTAKAEWHLPWLRDHAADVQCVLLRGCGHAVHHAAPDLVLQVVLHGTVPDPLTARGMDVTTWNAQARQARPRDQHTGYSVV